MCYYLVVADFVNHDKPLNLTAALCLQTRTKSIIETNVVDKTEVKKNEKSIRAYFFAPI